MDNSHSIGHHDIRGGCYKKLIATKDGRMICPYSKIPYKVPSEASEHKETFGEDQLNIRNEQAAKPNYAINSRIKNNDMSVR